MCITTISLLTIRRYKRDDGFPFNSQGNCIHYIVAIFSHGINVTSDGSKNDGASFASKATRYFLFQLHHPYSLFGYIVTKGDCKILGKLDDKSSNTDIKLSKNQNFELIQKLEIEHEELKLLIEETKKFQFLSCVQESSHHLINLN